MGAQSRGYTCREMSAEQRLYYDTVFQIEGRLIRDGIDHQVSLSWKWERLSWATGLSLVAPLEVRNEQEVAEVAHLARNLILRKTTLAEEFPGFMYDRANWLRDQAVLTAQSTNEPRNSAAAGL